MTRFRVALLALAILPLDAVCGEAQARSDATRLFASRAELDSLYSMVGPSHVDVPEVQMLRRRLTEGDFQVGDRIALTVVGVPELSDTFAVGGNAALALPNLPEMSLHGVLRSELQTYLEEALSVYVRDPNITATPLIRLAVLGEVRLPGFYHAPASDILSELITRAGGPTQNTDLEKSIITRGQIEVITKEEVQAALVAGTTLDRLNIMGGDEFQVGRRGAGATQVLTVIAAISGIVFALVGLSRLF